MKKMTKYDPEQGYAVYGRSNWNGILMRLEKYNIHIEENDRFQKKGTILFPGAYACITQYNKIEVNSEKASKTWVEMLKREKSEIIKVKPLFLFFKIMAVLGAVLMIICIFSGKEYLSYLGWSITCISWGLAYISQVIYMDWRVLLGDKVSLRLFRLHAAEHAAINAYYDLKRVPTLQEIGNYSGFSYNCGVIQHMKKAWTPIMIGVCRLAPGLWFLPLALVIGIPLTFWADKKNFYFTEVLYIAKPTELEYNVAIAALTEAVAQKDDLIDVEKNIEIFFSDSDD